MFLRRRLFRRSPKVSGAPKPSTVKSHIPKALIRESARALWASHRTDSACLIALASVAFGLGTMVFALLSPDRIWIYNPIFGPAVMAAAGHGFVEPVVAPGSALQLFLNRGTDQFDLNTLPENPSTTDLVPRLAEQHKYLLLSVAAVWRIFGISWTSVALLAGLFYALNAAFHFGLFRLIAGTVPAWLMTMFLVFSPAQLIMLPQFRDYSKAPFIAGGIWALGRLVLASPGAARGIAWSLGLGIVTGAGMGFRQDLLVFVPICLLVLPFISEDSLKGGWRLRIARTATFCVTFFAVAYGALSGSRVEGTGLFHNASMGLISPFAAEAGLTDASYSPGYVYADPSTASLFRNHVYRATLRDADLVGRPIAPEWIEPIPWVGEKYDDASASFYFDYITAFPWDFIIRGYAATLRVLDFAPLSPHWRDQIRTWGVPDFERRWLEERWRVLGFLYGTGTYLFAAAVLLAGAIRVRYGLTLAVLTMYFAGITSLQFDTRHYFHLEFVYWWMLLFVMQMLWIALTRSTKRTAETVGDGPGVVRYAKRTATTVAILAAIVGSPLAVSWVVQSRNVTILSHQWQEATLEKITVTPEPQPHGKVLIPGSQLLEGSRANDAEMSWASRAEYIVLEFAGSGEVIPIDFEYSRVRKHYDYSHHLNIQLPYTAEKKRLRLFVPMYFDRESAPEGVAAWFKGISLPEWYMPNLVDVARVVDVTPFPFLFYAAVPEDLKNFRRGLMIKGKNEPYYVRERRALRENLLANGGFELWNREGSGPILDGFGMPVDSTLRPETTHVFAGRYAARQVWSGSDAGHPMHEQFRIEIPNRPPNASYELFARACNFSSNYIVFKASEETSDSNGQTVMREVGFNFMGVPPVRSFQPIYGRFRTGPGESKTLFISIYSYGEASRESAVWDDFSLVEYEQPVL